ncbi:MAG: hypothetical protein ABGY75_04275 [Gemmataceae bacterium]
MSLALASWVGEVLPGPLPSVLEMVLNDQPDEEGKEQRTRLAAVVDDLPELFAAE